MLYHDKQHATHGLLIYTDIFGKCLSSYNFQIRNQEAGCDFNRWCNIWSRPEINLPDPGLIGICWIIRTKLQKTHYKYCATKCSREDKAQYSQYWTCWRKGKCLSTLLIDLTLWLEIWEPQELCRKQWHQQSSRYCKGLCWTRADWSNCVGWEICSKMCLSSCAAVECTVHWEVWPCGITSLGSPDGHGHSTAAAALPDVTLETLKFTWKMS